MPLAFPQVSFGIGLARSYSALLL